MFRKTKIHCFKSRFDDFPHLNKKYTYLNNGSFGHCPKQVLSIQNELRMKWISYPDREYFSNTLRDDMMKAQKKVANEIGIDINIEDENQENDLVCFVENSTVAASIIAQRWALEGYNKPNIVTKKSVLILSYMYVGIAIGFKAIIEKAGFRIVEVKIPFPLKNSNDILTNLEDILKSEKKKAGVIYALVDHTISQPSILIPIKETIFLLRKYGVSEIAVDGAHAIGSLKLDMKAIGADFYFSNIHKWGFAPHTSAFLYISNKELIKTTNHIIPSWQYGKGIVEESWWPGTRDNSAHLAVPSALDYIKNWTKSHGITPGEYNRKGVIEAAIALSEAWETEIPQPFDTCTGMIMVQLPKHLIVKEVPGVASQGLRSILRERYNIEAAIGAFGNFGYVRLSHAVYNNFEDFMKLRDAILELLKEQEKKNT